MELLWEELQHSHLEVEWLHHLSQRHPWDAYTLQPDNCNLLRGGTPEIRSGSHRLCCVFRQAQGWTPALWWQSSPPTPKTKLRPKIIDKMIAWPNSPKTWQKAIDLAVQLEQVEPSCKPKATTPCQSEAPIRLRGRRCRHSRYSYWPPQGNVKEISGANQKPLNVIVTTNKKERCC